MATGRPLDRGQMAGLLHIAYVQNLHSIQELNFNKLIYRIARQTLAFLSLFSGVILDDPEARGANQVSRTRACERETNGSFKVTWWAALCAHLRFESPDELEQLRRQKANKINTRKIKRTNKVMLTLYYLFTIHMLLNIFYQYSYDFNLMRLMRLRERLSFNETSDYEVALTMKLEETRAILKFIGAPYMDKSIIVGAVYLFIVLVALIGFYFYYLYYRYSTHFELHAIRDYLDFKGEQNYLERLVRAQVASFTSSERQFVEVQYSLANGKWLMSHLSHLRLFGGPPGYRAYNDHDQNHREQYRLEQDFGLRCTSSLLKMLASGALTPFNRSFEWFEMRTKIALAYQGTTLFYLILFSAAIVLGAILSVDSLKLSSLSDILVRVSSLGLMTLSSNALCLFGLYSVVASLDEIVLVNKLSQQVDLCTRLNSQEFFSLLHVHPEKNDGQPRGDQQSAPGDSGSILLSVDGDGATSSPSSLKVQSKSNYLRNRHQRASLISQHQNQLDYSFVGDKMNSNLLFILMHYKIFVAQSVRVIKPLNSQLVSVSMLLMLTPAIARIHQPYFQAFQSMDIRPYAITLSLAVLLPANMTLLGLCYFQSRCEDLYRALFSLMAHVIETESLLPAGKALYNQHLVTMLSKVLSYPENFLGQFKGRFSWNYTMVLKIHFWLGLIIISIISKTELTGQGFFDSFFNDPLGVF